MVELLNLVSAGPPMSTRSRAICGEGGCGIKTRNRPKIAPIQVFIPMD